MTRRLVAALVVATSLAVPVSARAEPEPVTDPAPEPQSHGQELELTVTCEGGLPMLERLYATSGRYEVLADIARCREELDDPVGAVAALKRYLEQGGEHVPDERRAAVSADIARNEARLARVTVTSDLGGVEVRVDGRCAVDADTYEPICAAKTNERVVLVNPGERRLNVHHTGYREIAHVLTLNSGEHVNVRVNTTRPGGGPENPYRDTMWTAWAVTGGAGVAATIVGLRTALSGQSIESSTGIATLALGGATVIAAAVATYFTVRSARWKPPVETAAGGLLLRF